MLTFIQIVNLRASSTSVNNKNQPGTQSSTREGNTGDGYDLSPLMLSFLKRGRKDAIGEEVLSGGVVVGVVVVLGLGGGGLGLGLVELGGGVLALGVWFVPVLRVIGHAFRGVELFLAAAALLGGEEVDLL
jgi:hypothetical protein